MPRSLHPLSSVPSPRGPAFGPEPVEGASRFAPSDVESLRADTPCADAAAAHGRSLLIDCGLGPRLGAPSAARPGGPSAALEWARSGAMSLTGEIDGPPLFAPGPLAAAARGAGLALAALAPDSDLAGLDAPALLGERAALLGLARRGRVSPGGSAQLLPTRDGWIVANLPREEDWSLVPAWLEIDPVSLAGSHDWSRVARALRDRSATELIERGRLMGLATAPVPAPRARASPGESASPRSRSWLEATHVHAREAGPLGSDRRIRVLDLSHLWAGPLATSLLARAGLDVLKLESPARPDGARRGDPVFFDLLHGGKRGAALDLRQPDDRTRFEALLETADVVVESARPRALEQLGYEAARWVDDRPGRIWASITGYGRRGPERDWIAYGDDAAVAAGLAWPPGCERSGIRGSRGGAGEGSRGGVGLAAPGPCFCGDAIADPLTGLHAAVAILGHLRAGRGGLLDLSLVGVAAHAAALPADTLVLPVEHSAQGWGVVTENGLVPVAAPRARPPLARAPSLRPPQPGRGWADESLSC